MLNLQIIKIAVKDHMKVMAHVDAMTDICIDPGGLT